MYHHIDDGMILAFRPLLFRLHTAHAMYNNNNDVGIYSRTDRVLPRPAFAGALCEDRVALVYMTLHYYRYYPILN